jgi:hypothetical protein
MKRLIEGRMRQTIFFYYIGTVKKESSRSQKVENDNFQ